MRRGSGILSLLILFFSITASAQAPKRYTAADIQQALLKMNVLGSVLYIAAHPDDENTRLIAWLSNEKMMNTGYLSLTRGDGGQNLIGSETGELLGVIRTQELLQARRVDGGKQFFTRANDFGYSKDADETFKTWDQEKLLADMVFVIRKFKPDVLITRFSPEPSKTHGHHTASAILAREAFSAAGDKTRFPEQLKYVDVWQPKRLLWNTSYFFFGGQENFDKIDKSGYLKADVGTYNTLLGKSYNEIAAESRSMHKSQGFGSTGSRGSSIEYFQQLKGSKAKENMFEGVNTSWTRISGGEAIGDMLHYTSKNFDPLEPSASVPALIRIYKAIQKLPDSYWKKVKSEELQTIIAACMGLFLEASTGTYNILPGDNIQVKVEAINRSPVSAELRRLKFTGAEKDSAMTFMLRDNQQLTFNTGINIPGNSNTSQPYWLLFPLNSGLFDIKEQEQIGLPENLTPLKVALTVRIGGELFEFDIPVVFKKNDPVEGEQYRPLQIVPAITVEMKGNAFMFPDAKPKNIEVIVSGTDVSGKVFLSLPEGWRTYPGSFQFAALKGSQTFTFSVVPPKNETTGIVQAYVRSDKEVDYTRGLRVIQYQHIPTQTVFPLAEAKIVRLTLKRKGELIGYLPGAGDDIPASLEQVGYNVIMLKDADMNLSTLKKFDAVIIGIRGYNTVDRLKIYQSILMEYVKKGGNMIVQYNTNQTLVTKDLAPYPIKISNERVSVENVPVRILLPDHDVMRKPNRISLVDFENWVQERGLYFPNEWAPEFKAVLSCNDPGETPKDGGLLVAKYGKGTYIYTSYSWFRQLPAGVPGAYRIFANMIAVGR